MSTYEDYRRLRVECGYDDELRFAEHVWNGCPAAAQENMLQQLRDGARQRQVALDRFGGDHW